MARPPAAGNDPAPPLTGDDAVLPFKTEKSGVLGHVVRLGPVVDTILSRHDYPGPVNALLGEAVALTAMLGVALKFDGKLILQTKTDGIVGMLVVNFEAPGFVRGYASFDKDLWASLAAEAGGAVDQGRLLGKGHLALTIDPGSSRERYQGIVGLDGTSLTDAALTYFRQSEQLPTFVRLAVARQYVGGEGGGASAWRWRAGGLMLQYLASEQEIVRRDAQSDEDEARLFGEDDDDWQRVQILASTVDDHELIDPTLAPERLLLRLFHEEGVRVYERKAITERCRCSKERVGLFLRQFDAGELSDMREPDGGVTVTCEFCSTRYRFEPHELD
jgi:molecular chaperone Hsp33